MGDLIGKQGIELSYEEILRGVKGIKFIQKDRFNKDIGPYIKMVNLIPYHNQEKISLLLLMPDYKNMVNY